MAEVVNWNNYKGQRMSEKFVIPESNLESYTPTEFDFKMNEGYGEVTITNPNDEITSKLQRIRPKRKTNMQIKQYGQVYLKSLPKENKAWSDGQTSWKLLQITTKSNSGSYKDDYSFMNETIRKITLQCH